MDSQQLFWATGINNSGLKADAQSAIEIFKDLSMKVNGYLDTITQRYSQLNQMSRVRFENPVDPNMVASIKTQIAELGKVIDVEIQKLGQFSSTYDRSMQRIRQAAGKITTVSGGSPLSPMVEGIQKDVKKATDDMSFLERRFKYMWGSMLAYGSVALFQNLGSDIIRVKTQFEQLSVAINSFVGNAETGNRILGELTSWAVKSPLQILDITDAAKQMLAYGDSADNVVKSVKMLGDIAAGSGQSVKDLAYLYGTSMTQGKLMLRDLYQFGNRGIPIYSALGNVLGKTTDEIMKMTSAGKIRYPELQKALESLTAAGGQYYNISEKMAATTSGQISNLKDKWTMAMKEIGDSQDGIINAGVQGITALISNWEALGKAIIAVAGTVGTYQVAKMLVGWSSTTTMAASNLAETQSLEALLTAENQAAIAKQNLTVGSVEYQNAIRQEMRLNLQKAAIVESTANAELAAAVESKAASDAAVIAAQKNLASKEGLFASTMSQAAAEEVATARGALHTAEIDANSAAQAVSTATTNAETAATAKNTIATGIDTAAKAGATAGTNLWAAAQVRLTAAMATFKVTLAATDPFILAATAIAGVVAIMWALHDSTTAAEKAEKKLKTAMDELQKSMDERAKGFNDRLNIIKTEAASDAEKQKAYQELKLLYGDIIGDMTYEQVLKSNSVELQKKQNDEAEKGRLKALQGIRDEAKAKLDAAKAELANTPQEQIKVIKAKGGAVPTKLTMSAAYTGEYYTTVKSNVKELQSVYDGAQKNLDEWTAANKDAVVKNKLSYKEQVAAAREAITTIKSELKGLRSGKGEVDDFAKAIEEKNKELKDAENTLSLLLTGKPTANGNAENSQERTTLDRIEAIRSSKEKIIDASQKAEIAIQDAQLSAMDSGYAKEKKQLDVKHQEKLLQIRKQAAELLKEQNDIAEKEYLVKNPKGVPPPAATALTADNQAIINKMITAENIDYEGSTKTLLKNLLIEYGDYSAERLEIERKYNADISSLEAERTDANSKQIDDAIRQAEVEKTKALMTQSFKKLKESPEFAMAFEDLGNVSTRTLEKLIAELEKYRETAAGTMKLSDFKEYASVIESITDKLIERNPYKVLKESADGLKDAQTAFSDAQNALSAVQRGEKILVRYEKVGGRIVPVYLSLSEAEQRAAIATENLTGAQNKNKKARTSLLEDMDDLFSKFSSIGDAVGGSEGDIISFIGQIGSFATAAIKGITAVVDTSASAISGLEKASIILTLVSLGIQLASKLISMLPSQATYEEKLAEINRMQQAVDSYAVSVAKAAAEEANWFGDDKLAGLKATSTQMALLLKQNQDLLDSQVKVTKEYGSFLNYHKTSYTTDLSKSLFAKTSAGYVDLVKWVSENLKDEYGNAMELFDENGILNYEAYQAILKAFEGQLSGDTEANLKALDAIREQYEEYRKELQSYVSDLFSPLVDDWVDAIWNWVDTGKDALDSFRDSAADTFRSIVSDMIKTLVLTNIVGSFQDDIQAAYESYAKGGMSEEELMAKVAALTAEMMQRAGENAGAIEDMTERIKEGIKAATGIDISSDGTNDTTSAIKSMSQESADILTAQFSAMRINLATLVPLATASTSNIGLIANNVKDIFLSLQTQANSLQIVFNDISAIRSNTDRLEKVEDYLWSLVNNGIKVK